ncbi:MAG TPA: PepSY domain-containing protein [Xanthobacteraceae bacterium]|nr:PepSY domain-containing protein [Xanthobacteraceae bacterium]
MKSALLALALATGLTASPALAQQFKVSEQQARQIASDRGVVKFTEIEQDDGKWEIEGRDKDGRKIEIDIHGQSGEVTEFEHD